MLNWLKITTLLFFIAAIPAKADESELGSTFAVVWEYTTDDVELIRTHLADQSGELLALWKEGIVENAYLSEEQTFEKGTDIHNIVFFIKADDKSEAQEYLDEFTFVEEGVARYDLYQVGQLWLRTYEDASQ